MKRRDFLKSATIVTSAVAASFLPTPLFLPTNQESPIYANQPKRVANPITEYIAKLEHELERKYLQELKPKS